MPKKQALGYRITLAQVGPVHDPAFAEAPASVKKEVLNWIVVYGLKEKDNDLAHGLDKSGVPMIPVSAATREHRESAMGPADPGAPPLEPAYAVSRTRLLLTGAPAKNGAEFWWEYDDKTGGSWGIILNYQRLGIGKKKVKRDVIGISEAALARVRDQVLARWNLYKLNGQRTPLRPPPPPPQIPAPRLRVIGRTDFESFTYGIGGQGGAAESRRALAAGGSTGFFQRRPGQGLTAFGGPGGGRPGGPMPPPVLPPPPRPPVNPPRPADDPEKLRRQQEAARKLAEAKARDAARKAEAARLRAEKKAEKERIEAERARVELEKRKAQEAEWERARLEAERKRAEAARGKPILPGRPIAERLKAYAEGDARVKAVAGLDAELQAEIARGVAERKSLQREYGVAEGTLIMTAGKKRRAALEEEMKAITRRIIASRDATDAAKGAFRARVHESLKTDAPVSFALTNRTHNVDGRPLDPLDAPTRAATNEAKGWLAAVTRAGETADFSLGVGQIQAGDSQRAHHYGGLYVQVKPGEKAATVVHELGHFLEKKLTSGGRTVGELAREFLAHRVGGEPLKKMNEVSPGANYDDDERGRKDKFDDAFGEDAWYVGKHYGSGSTEILSMGLEMLYNNPAHFAKSDPEFFKFVVGILSGALR